MHRQKNLRVAALSVLATVFALFQTAQGLQLGSLSSLGALYGKALKRSPLATHCLQGSSITALGDTASQWFEGTDALPLPRPWVLCN